MNDADDPRTTALRAPTTAEARAVARFDPRPTPARRALVHAVALSSRALMKVGNRVVIANPEPLTAARSHGRGLLTFSNHVSLFDDPWLTACLCGTDWESLRWIAADALNFFGGPLRAWFFNAGKCVPIVRGTGIDQAGMAFLAEQLRQGAWVHVFPEGGRTREAGATLRTPLKTGLAHLVRASAPLLLPFHHRGMEAILPIGARLPRLGATVSLRLGQVTDAAEGLASLTVEEITSWAEAQLRTLQEAT